MIDVVIKPPAGGNTASGRSGRSPFKRIAYRDWRRAIALNANPAKPTRLSQSIEPPPPPLDFAAAAAVTVAEALADPPVPVQVSV